MEFRPLALRHQNRPTLAGGFSGLARLLERKLHGHLAAQASGQHRKGVSLALADFRHPLTEAQPRLRHCLKRDEGAVPALGRLLVNDNDVGRRPRRRNQGPARRAGLESGVLHQVLGRWAGCNGSLRLRRRGSLWLWRPGRSCGPGFARHILAFIEPESIGPELRVRLGAAYIGEPPLEEVLLHGESGVEFGPAVCRHQGEVGPGGPAVVAARPLYLQPQAHGVARRLDQHGEGVSLALLPAGDTLAELVAVARHGADRHQRAVRALGRLLLSHGELSNRSR